MILCDELCVSNYLTKMLFYVLACVPGLPATLV